MTRVAIGRFAMVPESILRSEVSDKAKLLWMELSLFCSPDKPNLWIRQLTMAEKLSCSVRHIGRLVKELIKANLLVELSHVHQGRYKTYKLEWVRHHCPRLKDQDILLEETGLSKHSGQDCLPTIRVGKLNKEQIEQLYKEKEVKAGNTRQELPSQEALQSGLRNQAAVSQHQIAPGSSAFSATLHERQSLESYIPDWKKRFPCLDGLSGRPTLEECMEQALSHKAKHKYTNLKLYLDNWFLTASQRWIWNYQKEQKAKEAALEAERDKNRRLERLKVVSYPPVIIPQSSKQQELKPTPELLKAIEQGMANPTTGWLLKLTKNHRKWFVNTQTEEQRVQTL